MFAVEYVSMAIAVCYYDVRHTHRTMQSCIRPWLTNPDREIARRSKLRGRHQRGYGRHLPRYAPRPRKQSALLVMQPLPDLPMPTDGTEAWLVKPSEPSVSQPPVQVPKLPTTAELRLPFVPYDDTTGIDVTESPAVTDAIAQVVQEQERGLAVR